MLDGARDRSEQYKEWLSKVIFTSPILNSDGLFSRFQNERNIIGVETALVIEELRSETRFPFKFCLNAKYDGILHSSRRSLIRKIHIVKPSEFQVYHTTGLEKHCHYDVRVTDIALFCKICYSFNLEVKIYDSNENIHSNSFIVVKNHTSNMKSLMTAIFDAMPIKMSLYFKRNSNYSINYGFSSRSCEQGGPPSLTTNISKVPDKVLLPSLLSMICELTSDRESCRVDKSPMDNDRLSSFAQTMGSNLGYTLLRRNIFEGVDCSIRPLNKTAGCLLKPHCDVLNDWRPNHNICSAVKMIFTIGETKLVMSVIAYSRKAVGDYLYGSDYYVT